MAKHETTTWGGKIIKYVTRWYDTDHPLELSIDYNNGGKGGVLLRREDAVILRDMLIEVLGAPEPEPEPEPAPATTKPGEPVEFEASNGYTIVDRSPYALVVYDAYGAEKYKVGKYTVEALREYFNRPYVAPEPTLAENFAALPIAARFEFTQNGEPNGAPFGIKVAEGEYYRGGSVYDIGIHFRSPGINIREVV
jgi:hypothetical protein